MQTKLNFIGRADTCHTKELRPTLVEKATKLFADSMEALLQRGTPEYKQLLEKLPETHQNKLHYLIQYGVMYILESFDAR